MNFIRILTILMLSAFSLLLPLSIAHHAMAAEHNSSLQFMDGDDQTNCAKTTCVINQASTFMVALFSRFSDAIKILFIVLPMVALSMVIIFLQPTRSFARISTLSLQRLTIQQRK